MPCKLFFGCMFASKTWHLRGDLNKWHDLKYRVCYISTTKDTRSFISHSSCEVKYNYAPFKLGSLTDFDYNAYDVIGVDEGQFHADLPTVLPTWLLAGKRVVIAALKATSENKCFPIVANFISFVTEFVHLEAICQSCLVEGKETPATMTRCLVEKTTDELIGAHDEYVAVCLRHYYTPTLPSKLKRSMGAANWPSPPTAAHSNTSAADMGYFI